MEITVEVKKIGMWGLVMLTLGNIVNSMGIAVIAGDGYIGIALFLIASAFFSFPCLIVSNYLAVHYKHDGGLYYWVKQAFGHETAFMATWLQWGSVIVSFPAFMAFNVSLLAFSIDQKWLADNKVYLVTSSLLFVWLFTWFTNRGINGTVRLSMINTFFSYIIPIVLLFVFSIVWYFWGTPATHTPFVMANIVPSKSVLNGLSLLGVSAFMIAGLEMSAYFINYVKSGAVYKRGMTIAFLVITLAPIIAVGAMLTLVPLHSLSDKNGLMQSFEFFFNWIHFSFGKSIILFMYFIGQILPAAMNITRYLKIDAIPTITVTNA